MANTEVILKTKIEGLGAEADVVKVRSGFARNYLVPQGKAFEATRGNLRHIEALKATRAKREADELADADKIGSKIKRTRITLELQTGQGGKAFGSITTNDLATAIKDQIGVEIDRHTIQLDKPIKTGGSFDIPVKLHRDVVVDLRLTVNAISNEATEADEEETE